MNDTGSFPSTTWNSGDGNSTGFVNTTHFPTTAYMNNMTSTITENMTMGYVENVTDFFVQKTLQELNDEEFRQRIIPVIYIVLLMIVGIPGNILVLLVYIRHVKSSTHRTFITFLAAIDLAVCGVIMPFEITEMRFQYTFYAVAACKFFRALSNFLQLTSIFVLLSLSVDRFRRVCHPLSNQIIPRVALRICFGVMAFALFLSWPNFFLTGTRLLKDLKGNKNVTGYDCSISDQYFRTIYPTIYNGILFLVFIIVCVTIVVVYSCIGRKIHTHSKFRSRFSSKNSSISTNNTGSTDVADAVNLELLQNQKINPNKPSKKSSRSPSIKPVTQVASPDAKTGKITRIAFAISVAFVLSYLPHLTLTIMTAVKGRFLFKPTPVVLAVLPVVTRSTFINNVVNPFIYAALDVKFRNGVKKLFGKK